MLLRRKPKSFPPIESIELEGRWLIGESGSDGDLMLVRVNAALLPLAGHPDYPKGVYIEVPFVTADALGLPDEEELETLGMVEDALVAALAGDRQSLPAAVITRGGARKFLFYTRDADAALARVEAVDADLDRHELRAGPVQDERWAALTGFARMAR